MRVGFRQLIVLAVLVAFTGIYLNGTRIFSSDSGNGTYLSNLRYEGTGGDWNRSLFGEGRIWSSMENFIALSNDYDMRRAYGLLDNADEARYYAAFRNLARSAVNDWRGYQMAGFRARFAKQADLIPGWAAIRDSHSASVIVAGILAAAYTGRTLRYRLGKDFSLESRSAFHGGHLESHYLGWASETSGTSMGSSYDGATRGLAMSVRQDVASGVGVVYDHQTDNDAIGMVYSTAF